MQPAKTPECPERRRLARKVAETVAAVYSLREQENTSRKNDASFAVLLSQARTAQRTAEIALKDHLKEHGCLEPQ
jgi:hypothetical protein